MRNLKLLRYIYTKIKHGKRLKFCYSSIIGKGAHFEGFNSIGANSAFTGIMGHHSYMSKNCDIYASIGRFTSIGSNVQTIMFRHPTTYPYVSTSPVFYSTQQQCGETFADKETFEECVMLDHKQHCAVAIGNDVWINSNVTIISGVTIGDGAVVLAGAVVTRNVPPYSIVAGVPAKVIKYRFSQTDIEWLLKTKWWEHDINWIRDNWRKFNNIEKLKTC